jgi:arginyl-tRNA synthetase
MIICKELLTVKLVPHELAQLVKQAAHSAQTAGELPAFEMPAIEVRPPKKAEQGDYACAMAMQLAKPTGRNPFDVATIIAKHLPQSELVGSVEVVKPGFINIRLSETWLKSQVEAIIGEGEKLFQLDIGKGKRAQVEFVSANPTGPLHIGRSRGAMVGDTIARILEAAGYNVEREYYFNNAGVQMTNLGNSMRVRYLEALDLPVEIPAADDKTFYQGEYLKDFAQDLISEKGNTLVDADWLPFKEYAEQKMFAIIKETLKRVNVRHDVFFNENSLYDTGAVMQTLDRLDKAGYVYRAAVSENPGDQKPGETDEEAAGKGVATWFRSTALGDAKDRVLVKSDGNPTYTLPDIAYHLNKIERGFDLLVNILGADHGSQYKVVQCGVKALGYDPSIINVIMIQLVRAVRIDPETGARIEIKKMSTRSGDYDTLDDLIDLTSADVVRYLLLARSPDSQLDFDLDLAVKQSNENPVYYIQNAYVRCAGIFREAAARGLTDEGADLSLLGEAEMRFIRKALELGEVIELSATGLEPHKIAFYALELASVFHPIYDEVRALHGDVPAELATARLRFYRSAQTIFKRVLDLMGMSAPERM